MDHQEKLSRYGDTDRKCSVVNTGTANCNTVMRQTAEMSRRKKTQAVCKLCIGTKEGVRDLLRDRQRSSAASHLHCLHCVLQQWNDFKCRAKWWNNSVRRGQWHNCPRFQFYLKLTLKFQTVCTNTCYFPAKVNTTHMTSAQATHRKTSPVLGWKLSPVFQQRLEASRVKLLRPIIHTVHWRSSIAKLEAASGQANASFLSTSNAASSFFQTL